MSDVVHGIFRASWLRLPRAKNRAESGDTISSQAVDPMDRCQSEAHGRLADTKHGAKE